MPVYPITADAFALPLWVYYVVVAFFVFAVFVFFVVGVSSFDHWLDESEDNDL